MHSGLLVLALCSIALSTATFARSPRSDTITVDDGFGIASGWALESDDAYIGTRAGCMESLTRIDFRDQLQPSLATSWKQTKPDVWEFTLRKGVKFQDGQPLNAETTSNALNQLLKAPIPARAFSPKLISSVAPEGANAVRIVTRKPMVLLPTQLASPATSILSPAAYKGGKVNPVRTCTGPFIITKVNPTQFLTLKRYDNYWGGRPALAGAEYRFILDANVRAIQLRTHEADIARLVPPATLAQLRATPGITIDKLDAPRFTELLLNNQKPPLNNMKVRQAIQAAIDTAGLAAAVYDGAVKPAVGPFLPTDPWAPKAAGLPYNLERAKALLKEAGIKPGTLTLGLLAYTSKVELKSVAAVVQGELSKIGITVTIRLAQYNALEPDMLSGRYDMALMSRGYLTDCETPGGFFYADYACHGSFNISHYCNTATDAMITQAAQTADTAKRYDIYRRLAEKLQSEAITVFLIDETTYDAHNARVLNYRSHPLNYYLMTPALAVK